MDSNETRLVALVNALVDGFYPNPDDPGPIGPWGPWIREALSQSPFPHPWKYGPLPEPWRRHAVASTDDDWWQEHRPFPPYWTAALAALVSLAGQVDDHDNPFGGRRPRPNWALNALMRDLASLNPQPLPPIDSPVAFARNLANVALRRAREAGGEEGRELLRRFSDDWCGTMVRIPLPPRPVDPDEPRPPRPEESLVLGASLIRAAGQSEFAAVKQAAEDAGRRIFAHGLSGVA